MFLIILCLLVLGYLSYASNQTVSRESFKAYWVAQRQRHADASGSLMASLVHKVLPGRVPRFVLNDFLVCSVVTLEGSGDMYVCWLGSWLALSTSPVPADGSAGGSSRPASVLSRRSNRGEDLAEAIDARAQAALDRANSAKKARNYTDAAHAYTEAGQQYAKIARSDMGAALDAATAYHQAANAWQHPSINDPARRANCLRAALDVLDRAPSISAGSGSDSAVLSRRTRLTEALAETYRNAGDPRRALAAYLALPPPVPRAVAAHVADLYAATGDFSGAYIAFRDLLKQCDGMPDYAFRAGEFALSMILCGLVTRQYSFLGSALEDADAQSAAWANSRERSFLDKLERFIDNDDIPAIDRHLDSWHAMLDGWRIGVLRGWIMTSRAQIDARRHFN
ncbi:hypothetical protein H9P43_008156 [Blastocladiella emersonii ATCC 22665]|nr:hypothetical protein H9P43_008156 [Blastocladiella emersonii ATCC 22665]